MGELLPLHISNMVYTTELVNVGPKPGVAGVTHYADGRTKKIYYRTGPTYTLHFGGACYEGPQQTLANLRRGTPQPGANCPGGMHVSENQARYNIWDRGSKYYQFK